jgi:hypothetical protein
MLVSGEPVLFRHAISLCAKNHMERNENGPLVGATGPRDLPREPPITA